LNDGWTLVSITKEPDKVAQNPNAGKPDLSPGAAPDAVQPATLSTPTGRYIASFNTPGGQTRYVALVPHANSAPITAKTNLERDVNGARAEGPEALPAGSNTNVQNAQIAQAQAAAESSHAQADEAGKRAAQLQGDMDQIARNAAAGKGGLTDQQLATV